MAISQETSTGQTLDPNQSFFEIEWANANQLRQDPETGPIAWAPYLAVSGIGLFIKSPRQTAKKIYDGLKSKRAAKKQPKKSQRNPGWGFE